MQALLRLGRIGNATLSAAAVTIGALAAAESPAALPVAATAAAAAAGLLGTFGGNALNDLDDLALDRTAHPDRPLPSGALSKRFAAGIVLITWLGAIAASATVHLALVAFTSALLLLLILYERVLKARGPLGNLAVAIAAGALFPFGAVAVQGDLTLSLWLGGLAALAHLGRELLKDAEDAEADRAFRRTLAVTHGVRTATLAAAVALVGAVALSPLPALAGPWGLGYLLLVLPADVVFLVAAWHGPGHPGRARAVAKLGMALATAAFAASAFL